MPEQTQTSIEENTYPKEHIMEALKGARWQFDLSRNIAVGRLNEKPEMAHVIRFLAQAGVDTIAFDVTCEHSGAMRDESRAGGEIQVKMPLDDYKRIIARLRSPNEKRAALWVAGVINNHTGADIDPDLLSFVERRENLLAYGPGLVEGFRHMKDPSALHEKKVSPDRALSFDTIPKGDILIFEKTNLQALVDRVFPSVSATDPLVALGARTPGINR